MSEYDTDRMSEAVVIKCVNCGYPEARWYASYKEGKGWLCYDCNKGEPKVRCKACWELSEYCTCQGGPTW